VSMDRRQFLHAVALWPAAGVAMKMKEIKTLPEETGSQKKMPVLFVGHGSPMNGIEENEFVAGWKSIAKDIPRPKAVVCVSAHWETWGTQVTAMTKPRTIHDFGGFPEELYKVQYPAPGSPDLAKEISSRIRKTDVGLDKDWGLDHGCWVVVKRMYPDADVPVLQLSLDSSKAAGYHYELAKELSWLREQGVLIVGSGNMVHNLPLVAWDKLNDIGYAYDWAVEASEKMKKLILSGDHKSMIDYQSQGKAYNLAIPTPEHYLPLLYALALKEEKDELKLFNDKPVAGSLTMTSVKIG
jgi:4,5-DOPA dioxygenase extradiol